MIPRRGAGAVFEQPESLLPTVLRISPYQQKQVNSHSKRRWRPPLRSAPTDPSTPSPGPHRPWSVQSCQFTLRAAAAPIPVLWASSLRPHPLVCFPLRAGSSFLTRRARSLSYSHSLICFLARFSWCHPLPFCLPPSSHLTSHPLFSLPFPLYRRASCPSSILDKGLFDSVTVVNFLLLRLSFLCGPLCASFSKREAPLHSDDPPKRPCNIGV